jgi:LacI family transcriptional regulator
MRGGRKLSSQRRGKQPEKEVPPSSTTVTLREVAGECGFSITTVSMVLNASATPAASRISPATRERVWKAASRLGYRPNLFARSLRKQRSKTVGVVVFDITDPYCTQILRGIETYLQPAGYFPIVTDLQNERSQFDTCLDMLLGRRVEGIIAIANPMYLDSSLLSEFVDRQVPAVVIGRELKQTSLCSVAVDNESGAKLAMKHLYQLGHRHIACIKGPQALVDSMQRWRGIETFAKRVGLRLDSSCVRQIKGLNSTYSEGCEITSEMLMTCPEFTALVAFDDLTACGAIRALTKAGRRVPEDCSVVGFDDLPSAAFYNPPLTTVRQLLDTQGSLGAQLLKERIEAAAEKRSVPGKHQKVAPVLVQRESTGPARRS